MTVGDVRPPYKAASAAALQSAEKGTPVDLEAREKCVLIPLVAVLILVGILPLGLFLVLTNQTVGAWVKLFF